jgi:uncharacterized protein (TIGR00255 family)
MTGFGSAETETNQCICKVEIKALNGKFLDLNIKMPRYIQSKELEIRNELLKKLEKGSISILIQLNFKQEALRLNKINKSVAKFYLNEMAQISQENNLNITDLFKSVFDFPQIIEVDENETLSDELWNEIKKTIDIAFTEFDEFRTREGKNLCLELTHLIEKILTNLKAIEPFEKDRILNIRNKISNELNNLQTNLIDKNRFEQELIYYIEKLDINEEKSRLTEHCNYFLTNLNQQTNGKKLGFIAQEIGREINTIGSKSNDSNMQRLVVEMKDELEKIKEQLNNIC